MKFFRGGVAILSGGLRYFRGVGKLLRGIEKYFRGRGGGGGGLRIIQVLCEIFKGVVEFSGGVEKFSGRLKIFFQGVGVFSGRGGDLVRVFEVDSVNGYAIFGEGEEPG